MHKKGGIISDNLGITIMVIIVVLIVLYYMVYPFFQTSMAGLG